MTDSSLHSSPKDHRKSDTVLRLAVLGTLYALAIWFAVAFSPSMGLVAPHPVGEVGTIATVPGPTR